MKTTLLLITSLIFSNWASSQTVDRVETDAISCKSLDRSGNWVNYLTHDALTIDYQVVECDPEIGFDSEYVLFRLTNLTEDELRIDWHSIKEFNSVCITCDRKDEYTASIFVRPNQVKEGDCSIYSKENQLKFFSKFTDENAKLKDELTSFKLQDLVITRISQLK